MAQVSGIKGMLLEEIIIFLLEHSGYTCVKLKQEPSGEWYDDSLMITQGHSGMELKGRGANHQIDAIADFDFVAPFSYPIRLLVEAKCFKNDTKVNIEVIRNAFGVLADVNEGWTLDEFMNQRKKRYHYQYAVASTSGFSKEAIKYAYVHDIFLFDLSSSVAFQFIKVSLDNLGASDFSAERLVEIDFQKQLRESFRNCLRSTSEDYQNLIQVLGNNEVSSFWKIKEIADSCRRIQSCSYLGIIGKTYPVLLFVNNEDRENAIINDGEKVQIYWENNTWYIKKEEDIRLYTFALPKQLLSLYADNGVISQTNALNLKENEMGNIQIFKKNYDNNTIKCEFLKLDRNWLQQMKNQLDH